MDYAAFLEGIERQAHRKIKVVPVTKGHTIEEIEPLYRFGFREFGESRLQEAGAKITSLPQDISWHFIGSLQKNKVDKVLLQFDWIHSVDSIELAEKVASSALKLQKIPNVLLQVNASGESTKHGLSPKMWEENIEKILSLRGIKICGFMTMAPLTSDQSVIRHTFSQVRDLRDRINERYGVVWPELSMGMSRDYPIALEEGATILRIGSAFFGTGIAS